MSDTDWKMLEHHLEAASSIAEAGEERGLQGTIDFILREVKAKAAERARAAAVSVSGA